MIVSPYIIMSVLGTALVVGFLSINNYQLRKETDSIAQLAKFNDDVLDGRIGDCNRRVGEITKKREGLENDIKVINEAKAKVSADIQKTTDEGNVDMAEANEEYQKVTNELVEVSKKIANLTERWFELGGEDLFNDEEDLFTDMSSFTEMMTGQTAQEASTV